MEGNTCTGTPRCTCPKPDCMIRRGVDMVALLTIPVILEQNDNGPPPDCLGAYCGQRVDEVAHRPCNHGHP